MVNGVLPELDLKDSNTNGLPNGERGHWSEQGKQWGPSSPGTFVGLGLGEQFGMDAIFLPVAHMGVE